MSNKKKKTILLTGAGGAISVNLARSLREAPEAFDLVGCDGSHFYIHLALTDHKYVVPVASFEKEYLAAIRNIVNKHNVDLIIPSNMNEIVCLANHREEFQAKLFLPDTEAIVTGADKWRTFERLRAKNISVPKTRLVDTEQDVHHAFAEFGEPVWFRGRGVPGRGVGVASLPAKSPDQAKGWIDFHQAWGNMTAAEYLPGDNLTWMGLWKDGELVASQGRKRVAYVIPHVSPSGITGAPAVSHTIHDEKINDLGARAMLAMDPSYRGVGFVDFKCDRQGEPQITEVNVGRFGTTHHFYTVAGANFAYAYVKLALNEPISGMKPYNMLPADLYWIRSLDTGPVLVSKEALKKYPVLP